MKYFTRTKSKIFVGFRPKQIDSLYVDTTFCQPEAFYFPTREESADAVIELIEDWIKVLYIPQFIVLFWTSELPRLTKMVRLL